MTSSTNLDGNIHCIEETAAGNDAEAFCGDAMGEIGELCPRIEATPGAPGLQALVAYMWRLSLGDEVGHVPFKPVASDR